MEIAAERKIIVSAHIALDFPGIGSIAVHVDGLLLVAASPGSERRACGDGSIATGVVRIQRTKTMASKQPSKQAKSAAKTNKPARKPEHQPRKRISQGRSKSAATQAGSAVEQAAVAPQGTSESIDLSKSTTPSPEPQAAQSKPPSEGANMPGADRPRASTKRAMLIDMLERPEGASVAEIGQRLGWLPHTVRAAITGLRHAGREVTRSKDATGQSVYQLASQKRHQT
jgi:hypothetical protein